MARLLSAGRSNWNQDYHSLWSKRPNGWDENDHDSNCVADEGSSETDMQCCSNDDKTTPFHWINANNAKCCSNGNFFSKEDAERLC